MCNPIGVGEYKKLHHQFFTKMGIAHQMLFAHTIKNGSIECKHHHIVETCLAHLAHTGMPLKFWDEAIITSTHLIYHLPTHIIYNLYPLEWLFNTSPNCSMLHIFDCVCWPTNLIIAPTNTIGQPYRICPKYNIWKLKQHTNGMVTYYVT